MSSLWCSLLYAALLQYHHSFALHYTSMIATATSPLNKRWQYKQPKTYYDVKSSEAAKKRFIINQGGTRSGKTYSTLQVICELCKINEGKGLVISVVRKTAPSLKASAYRDFLDILHKENWYDESFENKTNMEYSLFGNLVEFFAVDEPQKMRGRKRHICFINEGNELTYEDFFQLNMRTTYKMIIDFNPSDEYCWIYDLADTDDRAILFKTNYIHNPFLTEDEITNIERLEGADDNYWKVYGLGERGASRELIWTHYKFVDELPGLGEKVFGQDFGYNVPSALVAVEMFNGAIYADELIYERKLITADLKQIYQKIDVPRYMPIYCDAAEPKAIDELCRYPNSYNAKPALKDVTEGIRKIMSMPLFITRRSTNLTKEIKNYKWQIDKQGKVLDEPVKFNDHACDALRYAVFTHHARPKRMKSYSSSY
jgi:phage terminase large subunit